MESKLTDLQAEAYAREHLLASGIVAELKRNHIYIWTIRAVPGKLYMAVDRSQNPNADMETIRRIVTEFLSGLGREIEMNESPIAGNCCYGACHGCLNGDPDEYPKWIQR